MYRGKNFFYCILSSVPATTFKSHFIYNFVYVQSGGSPEWMCCWHGHSHKPQTHRSGRAFPGEAQGNLQSSPLVPLQMWKVCVETIDLRRLQPEPAAPTETTKPCLAVCNKPVFFLIQMSKILGFLLLFSWCPPSEWCLPRPSHASLAAPAKVHMLTSENNLPESILSSTTLPRNKFKMSGYCKYPDPLSHFTSPSYYKYFFKHLTYMDTIPGNQNPQNPQRNALSWPSQFRTGFLNFSH